MRLLTALFFIFTAHTTFASSPAEGPWLDVNQDFFASINCKQPQVQKHGWNLFCLGNTSATDVLVAKFGERLGPDKAAEVAVNFYDATELYVLPEAETYRYESFVSELKNTPEDEDAPLVGYAITSYYSNQPLGANLRIKARYNLNGDLISAEIKEL